MRCSPESINFYQKRGSIIIIRRAAYSTALRTTSTAWKEQKSCKELLSSNVFPPIFRKTVFSDHCFCFITGAFEIGCTSIKTLWSLIFFNPSRMRLSQSSPSNSMSVSPRGLLGLRFSAGWVTECVSLSLLRCATGEMRLC